MGYYVTNTNRFFENRYNQVSSLAFYPLFMWRENNSDTQFLASLVVAGMLAPITLPALAVTMTLAIGLGLLTAGFHGLAYIGATVLDKLDCKGTSLSI